MGKRLPMPRSLAPTVHSVSIFPTWLVLHAEHEPQRQHEKTGVSGGSLGSDVTYPATISTLLCTSCLLHSQGGHLLTNSPLQGQGQLLFEWGKDRCPFWPY